MISLKWKYFLLSSLTASVTIASIGFLYYIGNAGFSDLVTISAKNANAIYTASELKSLLWKEISAANEFARGEQSLESLNRSETTITKFAQNLEDHSQGEQKVTVHEFAEIHRRLSEEIGSANPANRDKINQLYSEAHAKLKEFGEVELLASGEQQMDSVHNINFVMKCALLGALVLTFLFLSLSYFYFSNRVIVPVSKISSASLSAASGQFQPIYGLDSEDEIGLLARNFNYMIAEIQRSSEAIRAERDVAEKANHAKSAFLANMSHELRTPMHGILSFAKFGQSKIETATKERLKSYFDEIYDSGNRLMTVLNDILDLSKLESGKITYSVNQENLVETTLTVTSEVEAFAAEKKIAIKLAGEKPVICLFDSTRIMQVIRNLLTNAIKFSRPESVIEIAFGEAQDFICCRITNYGVGIPQSELKTIFDKFIQSSKTRTGAGGTGLGLAICKEIIEQHRGKIWAESDVDGKTVFTFELPRASIETLKITA